MVRTSNYIKCNELKHVSLDSLYCRNADALDLLDYNLEAIIQTEAPLTYNILKERLREVFDIKKISQKALDIILSRLKRFNYNETSNLYDDVIWADDIHNLDFVRINYQRQIYDIPKEEMYILVSDFLKKGYNDEELYRAILNYFGYEVLTQKATEYLKFVVEYTKNKM
ncbi:MAG: hypothetical protein ACI35W_00275 [Anaeroplasmataceae bacterium]